MKTLVIRPAWTEWHRGHSRHMNMQPLKCPVFISWRHIFVTHETHKHLPTSKCYHHSCKQVKKSIFVHLNRLIQVLLGMKKKNKSKNDAFSLRLKKGTKSVWTVIRSNWRLWIVFVKLIILYHHQKQIVNCKFWVSWSCLTSAVKWLCPEKLVCGQNSFDQSELCLWKLDQQPHQ